MFLLLADSADVWFALACFGALSLGYSYYRGDIEYREWRSWGKWGGLIALSVIFFFVGNIVWSVLPGSLRVASADVRPSLQGTFLVGKQVLSSPATLVFGTGPNTFMRQWSLYKPASVNQTPYWSADFTSGVGLVPTSLITIGALGFLAWMAFIVALLWSLTRYAMRMRRSPSALPVVCVGFAAVYLLLFHVLYAPGVALTMLTYLCVGIFLALQSGGGGPRVVSVPLGFKRGWRRYPGIAMTLVFLVALVVGALYDMRVTIAETLVNHSISVYDGTGDISRSSALLSEALFVYSSDARARRAGVELGIQELQQLAASPNADSDAIRAQLRATLETTIQYGLSAVSSDTGDYQNWLELASLYQNLAGAQVSGAYGNARAAYEKAQAIDPVDPLIYFRLAQLDVLQKDPQAALQDIKSALALKPDLAAAYYLQSQVYASQNELGNASSSAAQATRYAPGDPRAWYNEGVIAYAGGDWQVAVSSEEQALALNPQYANAMYVLGLSYYKLGRTADSLQSFRSLDTLDPGEQGVQQILSNLQAGKPPLLQGSASSAPVISQ